MKINTEKINTMRLDKWLWYARFYKARGLASNAIKTGKIKVNGNRAKPAKLIQHSDLIEIRRGPYHYKINVLALPKSRISASESATIYVENKESIEQREFLASMPKNDSSPYPKAKGRPGKKDRRKLIKFKNI